MIYLGKNLVLNGAKKAIIKKGSIELSEVVSSMRMLRSFFNAFYGCALMSNLVLSKISLLSILAGPSGRVNL